MDHNQLRIIPPIQLRRRPSPSSNKSLKRGDRRGAIEKLKLADMNIDVTLAVVPLEQTIKYVHQAANLINDGKYYEASQELRQAQDNERFDATNIAGLANR